MEASSRVLATRDSLSSFDEGVFVGSLADFKRQLAQHLDTLKLQCAGRVPPPPYAFSDRVVPSYAFDGAAPFKHDDQRAARGGSSVVGWLLALPAEVARRLPPGEGHSIAYSVRDVTWLARTVAA